MVKICQTGLLKLNFEIIPKKAFSGFCQKFLQSMDEVEFFLPISKSFGPDTSKCDKSLNHYTLLCASLAAVMRERILPRRGIRGG
jgi:hypothetical protein